jgi:MFS family permease
MFICTKYLGNLIGIGLMLRQGIAEKSGITSKAAFLSIFLVSNAFVWYYYAGDILREVSQSIDLTYFANLQIWAVHFVVLIVSALVGAFLTGKIGSRDRFMSIWMLLGTASPFALLIIKAADVSSVTIMGLILGLSFGIGMPNCMGYFTSHNRVETRGRLGGMMMLLTGLGVIVLEMTVSWSLIIQVAILAAWRGVGLLFFVLSKPKEEKIMQEKTPSYRAILRERSFMLYFVPWMMFSLVNYLTTPVRDSIFEPSIIATLLLIENGLIGLFAIIGGFLVDTVGRKRVAIVGFVMLGLSYAVLGTSPESLLVWYLHTAVDGVAWGMLLVIFVATVWGDLSHNRPSDKYYAAGVFPFFVSSFLPLVVADQITAVIPAYAIFSFTAFFLFLAVLPLVYAPETLPEKTIKDRELKNYIKKAKEEAAKAQEKENENAPRENGNAEVELEVKQEDFEKAAKEAEKYY